MTNTNLKRFAAPILLMLVSLSVFLLLFEIVLRIVEPPLPTNEGSVLCESSNPQKRYGLLPNASGMIAGAIVHINSFGARDKEYPLKKADGVVRIVGVGNSLTFGQGVLEEETYLALLEERLSRRYSSVEVINCGVFGYNVDEVSARFLEVINDLSPDIIVIGFELGDVLRNPKPKTSAIVADAHRREVPFYLNFVNVLKESRVATFLSYRFSFLLKRVNLRNWEELYQDGNPLWENFQEQYKRIASQAAARGVIVVVAVLPELSNLNELYPFHYVHDRVSTLCSDLGFIPVDLFPAFKGMDGPSLWIHPRDRHPNPQGHEIIANGLMPVIEHQVVRLAKPE